MLTRKRRQKDIYEDVLDERRKNGEIGWLTRTRRLPKYRFSGDEESPQAIKASTLQSERIECELRRLSEHLGQPVEALRDEAGKIMDEMGHALTIGSVKSFGFVLAKVMKCLYKSVYVNPEGIMKIRAASKDYPIVLLPSHRTYADFLLMSYLFFDYDLPLPVIAAAIDFTNMKFFGSLLRRCGAFFIRRSFATDPLYWLVFTEYVRYHLRSGQHPIEFFLEGTRSRTGKSLVPKTGMLGSILESWFLGEVSDVYLVPVSITHDRLLEESLHAHELLGIPKPKESTSGLFKARGILNEDYGNVHFYIHDPVSLRSLAENQIDRSLHNLQPRFSSTLFKSEMDFLKRVAYKIVNIQQSRFVISPWCLIAVLLSHSPDGLAKEDLKRRLPWFRDILQSFGAHLDWPAADVTDTVIQSQLAVHHHLVHVDDSGKFSLVADDDVLSRAAGYMQLAGYRNHLMHCLISEALVSTLILNAAASGQTICDVDELEREFNFLHELFQREFVLDSSNVKKHFSTACNNLFKNGALSLDRQTSTVNISESVTDLVRFLVRIFEPFLYGYSQTLNSIWSDAEANQSEGTTEKDLAKRIQQSGFELAKRNQLKHFDALSMDLIMNAITVFTNFKLFDKHNKNDKTSLVVISENVKSLRDKLDTLYAATQESSSHYADNRIAKL